MTEIIIAAVAALGGIIAALWHGRKSYRKGKTDAEQEAIQDDLETAKRIDAVRSLDADAALDRLRERVNARDL